MKRLLPLFLVVAASLLAAPWDGTKGNITLFTTSFSTGMPGLVVMPNPTTFTLLWLRSTDPSTTSFRITVKYTADQGQFTAVTFCDRPQNNISAAAAFQLNPSQISSVVVEELRATSPVEFQ